MVCHVTKQPDGAPRSLTASRVLSSLASRVFSQGLLAQSFSHRKQIKVHCSESLLLGLLEFSWDLL